MKKRSVAIVLSLVLVFCCAVGGVLAWLTAKTDPVVNTFTVGNIDISLTEGVDVGSDGKESFKMVPGNTITKDPKVTVEAGSEACWLFVKVKESENLSEFIEYSVNTAEKEWTQLKDDDGKNVKGVYYRQVDADTAAKGATYNVLSNDQVTVKEGVTKDVMGNLTDETQPTLTFTAYACQLAKGDEVFTPAEAWAEVNPAPAE